jgi:hypothetical protein
VEAASVHEKSSTKILPIAVAAIAVVSVGIGVFAGIQLFQKKTDHVVTAEADITDADVKEASEKTEVKKTEGVSETSGSDVADEAATAAVAETKTIIVGWQQDDHGWKYLDEQGEPQPEGWFTDTDGSQYYFDADGYMLADTVTPDGYYVNASGAYVASVASVGADQTSTAAQSPYMGTYYHIGSLTSQVDGGNPSFVKEANPSGDTITIEVYTDEEIRLKYSSDNRTYYGQRYNSGFFVGSMREDGTQWTSASDFGTDFYFYDNGILEIQSDVSENEKKIYSKDPGRTSPKAKYLSLYNDPNVYLEGALWEDPNPMGELNADRSDIVDCGDYYEVKNQKLYAQKQYDTEEELAATGFGDDYWMQLPNGKYAIADEDGAYLDTEAVYEGSVYLSKNMVIWVIFAWDDPRYPYPAIYYNLEDYLKDYDGFKGVHNYIRSVDENGCVLALTVDYFVS